MYNFDKNIDRKEEASRSGINAGLGVFILGSIFLIAGICAMIFDKENGFGSGIGIIVFFGLPLFLLGTYRIVGQLIYNKQPWKSERILLVRKVIPIREENRKQLHRIYDIESDELNSFKALELEDLFRLNDGIDRYVIEFTMYGKFNREKFKIGDFNKEKIFVRHFVYNTTSDKFSVNQLYTFDIMKFGMDVHIDWYHQDDFEFLGNIY